MVEGKKESKKNHALFAYTAKQSENESVYTIVLHQPKT